MGVEPAWKGDTMKSESEAGVRSRKFFWFLAGSLYLFVATGLLSLWRLPAKEMVQMAEVNLEKRPGWSLDVGAAGVGWLGSLWARGVSLKAPWQKERLQFSQIDAGPSWWGLLWGTPVADAIFLPVSGGRVEIRASFSGLREPRLGGLSLEASRLNLMELAAAAGLPGGRILGQLQGSGRWELGSRAVETWQGAFEVSARGVVLEGISLGGLRLDRLGMGAVELRGRLEKGSGILLLERGRVSGSDVELQASGQVVLSQRLSMSRLDLEIRLKLAGQAKVTYEEILDLMGYRRGGTGWIEMSLGGTLERPRLVPKRG